MRLFKKSNQRKFNCQVNENIKKIINYYMMKKNLSFNDAVNELIEKGYNYWLLEEKYKDKVNSKEVWSSSYRILRVEAGFLYYRLRTRELVEELKNIVFILSGVVADLESCYEALKRYEKIEININKLKKYRDELNKYLKSYVLSNYRELEEAESRYVDNWEEFIKELEKLIKKVKNQHG